MPQAKKIVAASARQMDQWMKMAKNGVKLKHRGVFSFDERMAIKIRELKNRTLIDVCEINNWKIRQFYFKDIGKHEYIDADWRPFPVGSQWGGLDVSAFIKQKVRIPAHFKGKKVILQMYLGGDSLLSINGEPFHGLDPFRNVVTLTLKAHGDEVYDMLIEAYQTWHAREDKKNILECSSLAAVDTEIEEIYWDYMILQQSLATPNIGSSLNDFLVDLMEEAIRYIDPYAASDAEFKNKARIGQALIRERLLNSRQYHLAGKEHMIGNSHIDLVFLWHYREFLRKIARTHTTVLRLMEEFPDFIFSQSQACMYKEMKRLYPQMYAQVKQRIREGRWEPVGAMWVEPDSNLPSGESFVRQIMFGTRFYEKEFNVTPRTCWMPDCFGNAATLPMILAKAGVRYFVTHKMSVWNDTNPWKINQFWWEAPDGSRVFAVVPPMHFTGTADPDHISSHWHKYIEQDKDNIGQTLYCYGWGDGGGGVDAEMLNFIKRYVAHGNKYPGLPTVKPAKIETALEEMRRGALDRKLTVWKDELYLEAHRGVHTTKGRLKKLNRYSEYLYRDAELFSSIARGFGHAYAQDRLNAGWEKLLTNQFHDSLPGSHIKEVYGDLLNEYDGILEIGEDVRKKAIEAIARHITVPRHSGRPFAVFNSLPHTATMPVMLDAPDDAGAMVFDMRGKSLDCQRMRTLEGVPKLTFMAPELPGVGYRIFYLGRGRSLASPDSPIAEVDLMENRFFRIALNDNGEIISLFDKRVGREVLKPGGKGNAFRIYEDIPSAYEAWDITLQYLDRELPSEKAVVTRGECGPVCAWINLEKRFFNSRLKQRIIIYRDMPRIDFETEVDWVERKKLLKVGFDVDIASKHYTSDIPFGSLERPNYRFVDSDKGKYEVCAHTWIDMSQADYGVSILNDCKYGHDVTEQTMTVTLLKGPTYPDPDSDIEKHRFTYSLCPHAGPWQQAGTIQRALELNVPPQIAFVKEQRGTLPPELSFINIPHPNLTLEAVKKAEESDDLIVRVVDRCGNRTDAAIALFAPVKKAWECDLLEREIGPLRVLDGKVRIVVKPFEVKTVKVRMQG